MREISGVIVMSDILIEAWVVFVYQNSLNGTINTCILHYTYILPKQQKEL